MPLRNCNGNWIARDEERPEMICPLCSGTGMQPVSKALLKSVLSQGLALGAGYKELMKVYREWQRNDEQLECPTCEGKGVWYGTVSASEGRH